MLGYGILALITYGLKEMMMRLGKKMKNNRYFIISCAVLFMALLMNAWYLFARGAAYVDSDMASNFIAAVVNNSEGTMLSKNWYYSTAVEVFQDVNIYQLVLLFVKKNYVLARGIGILIMQLMLVASFILFLEQIGIMREKVVLFSAFLISPMCYWLFLLIGFGGFYIMNTVFVLLTLNAIFAYVKYEKKTDKRISIRIMLYWSLMMFSGVISGINGIKSAIFPYAPLAVATVIIFFLALRKNPEKLSDYKCYEWKLTIASGISLASFSVGYIINIVYISKNFYSEGKDNMVWGPFRINNLLDGISDCLMLLGYQNDEHLNWLMHDEMSRSVFSLQGIANLFGLALITYFIFSVIRILGRYEELSDVSKTVLIILICTWVVDSIVFKLTDGYVTTPAYWEPVLPIMLAVIAIEQESEKYTFRFMKLAVPMIMTLCVVITSYSTAKLYGERPLYANPQICNVVEWLQNNGYTKGYGTFWQSNVVTFLSNGEIDMWNVHGFDNLELHKWLQKKLHDERPRGDKIFALIGPKDDLDRDVFLQYMNLEPGIPEIVYSDEEGYIVVEYKR